MWDNDPKSTSLEQAYASLFAKANFDQYWSLAELRLDEKDVRWLKDWFVSLKPDHSILTGSGEKLGALLLCLGEELCREKSTEDSVWPSIRNILPEFHPIRTELFLSNGQPSQLAKGIIVNAVRSLNLRNAFDIEGTLQWYVTVKLQFGFTYRGARSRLAEWLVGFGQPHAVQYLNGEPEFGELSSESFRAMWRTLRQLRQGLIGEAEARQTLLNGPEQQRPVPTAFIPSGAP